MSDFISTDIYIDGAKMPAATANGITFIPHKIWGSNAGRSGCTGDFVGDIVNIKWEIQITWQNISDDDFAVIDAAVNSMKAFLTVKFCPKKSAGYITRTFYANDPQYPVLKCMKGSTKYGDVTVTLIEQ